LFHILNVIIALTCEAGDSWRRRHRQDLHSRQVKIS